LIVSWKGKTFLSHFLDFLHIFGDGFLEESRKNERRRAFIGFDTLEMRCCDTWLPGQQRLYVAK
jgi:hypothetical protein